MRDEYKEITKKWYDNNAASFENCVAIEKDFQHLDIPAQKRLNYFKLWHILYNSHIDFRDKDILEFGCGHGRLAIEIEGYRTYTGVDFSEQLVALGNKRIEKTGLSDRARLVTSDCLLFKAQPCAYDIVCSLGMFSNIENATAVLEKMVYHLKPGGILFIDGHHSSFLYNSLRMRKQKRNLSKGNVYKKYFYHEKEIRSLFQRNGLTEIQVVMREYPFLGALYARRNFEAALKVRNLLASIPFLNFLGTDLIALARKKDT